MTLKSPATATADLRSPLSYSLTGCQCGESMGWALQPCPPFPCSQLPSPSEPSSHLFFTGGLYRLSKPQMEGQCCRPQVTAPGAHLLPPTSAQPFLCLYVPFVRELELGTGVALSAPFHFVDGIRSLPLKCQGNYSLHSHSLQNSCMTHFWSFNSDTIPKDVE